MQKRNKLSLLIIAICSLLLAFSSISLARRSVAKCSKNCGSMVDQCKIQCKKGIKKQGGGAQALSKCNSMCDDVKNRCLTRCKSKRK
jgi:uncharacterized protein YoxC